MREWTNISLVAFHILFYKYEPADEIIQSNYNTNLIVTILKVSGMMAEFDQKAVYTFIESNPLLKKIKKETNLIKLSEIENAWNSVVITNQIWKIIHSYIDMYRSLLKINKVFAFNLFIYDIPIVVLLKYEIPTIILRLNEYELLILKSTVKGKDFRFFNYDFRTIYSSLIPLSKRFLIKTLLKGTNIMIRWELDD